MAYDPQTRIKLAEVPGYLDATYEMDVSRQTVYNWANHGRQGEKLQTLPGLTKLTTPQLIDDFVAKVLR